MYWLNPATDRQALERAVLPSVALFLPLLENASAISKNFFFGDFSESEASRRPSRLRALGLPSPPASPSGFEKKHIIRARVSGLLDGKVYLYQRLSVLGWSD